VNQYFSTSIFNILSRVRVWLKKGYGPVNGFIDYLYTLLKTTSNYVIANPHNSQITTAPVKPFQPAVSSPVVLWRRLLTVEFLQLNALRFYLLSFPYRTQLIRFPSSLLYNISARTAQTAPRLLCCIRNRCHGNVFTEPLPRNVWYSRPFHDRCIVTAIQTTICSLREKAMKNTCYLIKVLKTKECDVTHYWCHFHWIIITAMTFTL
jgi:hypothetical protein